MFLHLTNLRYFQDQHAIAIFYDFNTREESWSLVRDICYAGKIFLVVFIFIQLLNHAMMIPVRTMAFAKMTALVHVLRAGLAQYVN